MIVNRVHQMTVEEYLAFEVGSEIKNEYIDGEIYAMTGGTGKHSSITINTIIAIGIQLRSSDCSLHSSDMRIKVGPSRYVYPDLSAVCGKATYDDDSATTLLNPVLVIEVTSPSSIDYDRVIKREYYSAVESLQAYLVIDQHRALAELYTRTQEGWNLQQFAGMDAVAPLDVIGCSLPLTEVYRGITFEAAASSATIS